MSDIADNPGSCLQNKFVDPTQEFSTPDFLGTAHLLRISTPQMVSHPVTWTP